MDLNSDTDQGMSKTRKLTRLQKLKKSWKKSSAQERSDFLDWLTASGVPSADLTQETTTPRPSDIPIASGRYLTPSTIARIKDIMAHLNISADEIMVEIGFDADGPTLLRAPHENASLRLAVVTALEKWLATQE